MFVSNKIGFKSESVIGDEERHYIMIEGSVHLTLELPNI